MAQCQTRAQERQKGHGRWVFEHRGSGTSLRGLAPGEEQFGKQEPICRSWFRQIPFQMFATTVAETRLQQPQRRDRTIPIEQC